MCALFLYVDSTVSFKERAYYVSENDISVQPVLVLSNPSSTDVTVQVAKSDQLDIGKYF